MKFKINKKVLIPVILIIIVLILISIFYFRNLALNNDSIAGNFGNYEAVVSGGGTSGIGAALQLARKGNKVLLLEQTDWIGGQLAAAGVSTTDEKQLIPDSGIFGEFINNINNFYTKNGRSISTCYWGTKTRCMEPSVAEKIMLQMIGNEPNITLNLRSNIKTVNKTGNKITSIIFHSTATNNNFLVNTKVLIDATEYGDVIPLTGLDYRVGNSTNKNVNLNQCIQNITYNAVVRKYFDGVPNELKIKPDMAPPGGQAEYAAMKAIFIRSMNINGNNWYINGKAIQPFNWNFFSGYRGLPDSNSKAVSYSRNLQKDQYVNLITKTELNLANDYPATEEYIQNPTVRRQIDCKAKIRTMQYIYYMQIDMGMSDWSISNDEGYDTAYNLNENACPDFPQDYKAFEKYLPIMPYVRESRRLIGDYTLIGKDIKSNGALPSKPFSTSIALGDYFTDLHNCRSSGDLEKSLDNVSDLEDINRVFQVPLESLYSSKLDNFIVAEKNISQSRIANAATREQPITMNVGQAAGALADLIIKKNMAAKDINHAEVQLELGNAGLKIALLNFKDVADSTNPIWPYLQVASANQLEDKGSNTNFDMNFALNRARASVILDKLFNLSKNASLTNKVSFTDLLDTGYYYNSASLAYNNGMILPCSTSGVLSFCPSKPISRGEFAFALAKAMGLDSSLNSVDQKLFSDVSPTDKEYISINNLYNLKILNYCDSSTKKFCPSQDVSRADEVKIITSFLINYK